MKEKPINTGKCRNNTDTNRSRMYALSQAAINIGCSVAQRENIEEACRTVEIRPTAFITIKGDDNQPFFRFADTGDLVLHDGCLLYTEYPFDPEYVPYPNSNVIYISDNQGELLLLGWPMTNGLFIKGKVYENISDVWDIPYGSIIINNSSEPVAYLTSTSYFDWVLLETIPAGSLILQGKIIYLNY